MIRSGTDQSVNVFVVENSAEVLHDLRSLAARFCDGRGTGLGSVNVDICGAGDFNTRSPAEGQRERLASTEPHDSNSDASTGSVLRERDPRLHDITGCRSTCRSLNKLSSIESV